MVCGGVCVVVVVGESSLESAAEATVAFELAFGAAEERCLTAVGVWPAT